MQPNAWRAFIKSHYDDPHLEGKSFGERMKILNDMYHETRKSPKDKDKTKKVAEELQQPSSAITLPLPLPTTPSVKELIKQLEDRMTNLECTVNVLMNRKRSASKNT
jgi:hypothetical protein